MSLYFSVRAKATSGQEIEIHRWSNNYALNDWFLERSKSRGEPKEIADGAFITSILREDIIALRQNDMGLYEWCDFLAKFQLGPEDVDIMGKALADGFTLTFCVA